MAPSLILAQSSNETDEHQTETVEQQTEADEDEPTAADDDLSFSNLVERALTNYKDGDYEATIRDLTVAYRKKSKSRLLFNLGLARDKLDDCAGSLVYFRSYLRQEETEEQLVERAEEALANSDECEAFGDDLAGRLAVYSTPSGATVEIDGEERGQTPLEVVGLSTGSHLVRFDHPDRASTEFEVELTAERDRTVDKQLPAERQADEEDGFVSELDEKFTPLKPTTIALGSAGAGFLLTGMIADFALLSQTNRKLELTSEGSALHERYAKRQTSERAVAYIGYLGSLALVGSGVAWQLLTPSPSTDATAAHDTAFTPPWSIAVSPNGVTIDLRF